MLDKIDVNKIVKVFIVTIISSLSVLQDIVKSEEKNWIKPLEGTIPNPFGNNYQFFNMYRAGHTGIDIKAEIGTPIHAVADGTVRFIKTKRNMRYGNYIVLEHKNGLYTLYAHLQKVMVTLNQKVSQGTVIARTGVSGLASFPHLHFEVTSDIPVRDGAWGYNYICQKRTENLINKEMMKRNKFEKVPSYDFLPLTEIQTKFSFINADSKKMEHFYRMKDNICIEKAIVPITYYNPEKFLPKYQYSVMADFNKLAKPKNKVNKK